MRIAVTIVTWNSMKHLAETLASLKGQTYRDFGVVIVDNASMDGVEKFVHEEYPEIAFIRNARNLGFSRGHNQAITYAKARLLRDGEDLLILVTNPDIILEPEYLERINDAARRNPDAGSFGGKLLKVYDSYDGEMRKPEFSRVIDSTGLRLTRMRVGVDRGSGEEDAGQFDGSRDPFGVSGALALYRLSALEDVAADSEYFDEDFFAYKEDVDLAWRLRTADWRSVFEPSALAYHYRTADGREKRSLLRVMFSSKEIADRRSRRSPFVNYLSTRNQLLVVAKNDHALNYFFYFPLLAAYEVGKFLYVAAREPLTLRAYGAALKLLPKMLRKRGQRKVKATAAEARTWMK